MENVSNFDIMLFHMSLVFIVPMIIAITVILTWVVVPYVIGKGLNLLVSKFIKSIRRGSGDGIY